jgi:hypothetical protein
VPRGGGGDAVWSKNFGGNIDDRFNSVVATSDGGFVAVGSSDQGSFGSGDWVDFTPKGSGDAVIVKFNASGSIDWKKNFGGSDGDYFNSVAVTSDGGFVAVGYSASGSFGNGDWTGITGNGNTDAILVKFNAFGGMEWRKNFGGGGSDEFRSVTSTSDGGFVAVGLSNPLSFNTGDWTGITGKGGTDAIIVKFNAFGGVEWGKNFGGGGYEEFSSVTATNDGGLVAVGYAVSGSFGNGDWAGFIARGNDDAIIVKFKANGDVAWKKNFGGSGDDCFYSVTSTSDGGLVAVGYSYSDSFGNGDWAGITGNGNNDAIIVKFNAFGGLEWRKNFGGSGYDTFRSVTSTSDGGLVVVGYSYQNSFGNGDWTGITGKGGYDVAIVKFNANGSMEWKNNFGGINIDYTNSVAVTSDGGLVAVGYSSQSSFGTGDWTGSVAKGYDDATVVKFSSGIIHGDDPGGDDNGGGNGGSGDNTLLYVVIAVLVICLAGAAVYIVLLRKR